MSHRLNLDHQLRERAQSAFPSGVYGHQASGSVSPSHPQFISRAEGCRLWDVDGNEYIDFMCGYGTNLLGYQHKKVDGAAQQQQQAVDCASGPAPIMLELAEKFNSIVDHADWTMFAKNGTDATTICVMTARAQTKKSTIIVAEGAYHGAGPWCTPGPAGVTLDERKNQLTYQYNDVASLQAAVTHAGDDLAAIIVSPFKHDAFVDQQWPSQEFAETARRLCDQSHAALILDDVRCAFRFTLGATWQVLGVKPDLCAMSKSVANGYALAVITGNNKFRQGASDIYSTGSFWFAATSFAASLATIEVIEQEGILEIMKSSGDLFRNGLDQQASAYGFKLNQTGPSQMPLVLFQDDPDWQINNQFCQLAAEQGVYMHPWHNMFISAAHSEQDIQIALNGTERAFAALRKHFG